MSVCLINANSVRNKTCLLRDFITDNKIDIMCVTETWIKENETAVIAALVPETHLFCHNPRDGGYGGVGMIFNRKLGGPKSVRVTFDSFECLEVCMCIDNRAVAIYVIYRPPGSLSSVFLSEFESFLLEAQMSHELVLYVGDFNIWVEDSQNRDAERFLTMLHRHNLKNHVNSATNDYGHTLDLVLTHVTSDIVKGLNVEPFCTISDHRLVRCRLNLACEPNKTKTIKFRQKNNINSAEFCSVISAVTLPGNINCPHSSDIEGPSCCNCLVEAYKVEAASYIDRVAPVIQKSVKYSDSTNLWYNSEIRIAKRKMRKAEKLYIKTKAVHDHDEFRRLRNLKCKLVSDTKVTYFQRKISECENNSKKLFSELNKLLGKNSDYDIKPTRNNDLVLANEFKDFFIGKVNLISESFGAHALRPSSSLIPDFPLVLFNEFTSVSIDKVLELISETSKTCSKNDPFSFNLLQLDRVSNSLAKCFCTIINQSFNEGVFPTTEKFATVKPLIKGQSDPEMLSSYRPLYNMSFLSKILEKAALVQLLEHFSRFDAFPKVQSAYREFHSVESAMCRIYSDLVRRKCEGKCTMLILLDLSAAFDTIDHTILLNDLQLLGVTGSSLSWLRSYLTGRNFSVVVGDFLSDRAEMSTGIPQGSTLGPVLFIVYMIELYYLLESFNVDCHFYADDTQVYFTVETTQQGKAKFDLIYGEINKWMKERRLKLNAKKTEILLIGSSINRRNLADLKSIEVMGENVELPAQVKSLGVILDQDLNMRAHLNKVKRNTMSSLVNIARIAKFIDRESRMKLVHCLVFSVMDFCNSLYYGLPNIDLHPLQMIINKAIRVVVGLPRFSRERITPYCIENHVLPLKARVIFKICMMAYKALRYHQPKYIYELLKIHAPSSERNLRSHDDNCTLVEPMISRHVSIQRSFEYCAPRLFNRLPLEIRASDSIAEFKKMLKTFLFRESYDLSNLVINPSYAV